MNVCNVCKRIMMNQSATIEIIDGKPFYTCAECTEKLYPLPDLEK